VLTAQPKVKRNGNA